MMDYNNVLLIETWKMDQEELQNFVVKKLIPLADELCGKFSYQFFITDDLGFFVCRMCPDCGYMTENRIGPFRIAQKLLETVSHINELADTLGVADVGIATKVEDCECID